MAGLQTLGKFGVALGELLYSKMLHSSECMGEFFDIPWAATQLFKWSGRLDIVMLGE